LFDVVENDEEKIRKQVKKLKLKRKIEIVRKYGRSIQICTNIKLNNHVIHQ